MLKRKYFSTIVIILNPIIDIVFNILQNNSSSGISLNQLIRIALLCYAMLCLREWASIRNSLIFLIWLALCLAMQNFYGMTLSLLTDIGFAVKLFSGYVYYRMYYEIFKENQNNGIRYFRSMFVSSIIVIINIFLGALGIGGRTYADSTDRMSGYIGFLSGNCITAICLMILFIVNITQYGGRKGVAGKIFLFINFIALLLLATKFSVIGTLMIIVAIFLYEVYASKGRRRQNLILVGSSVGILSLVFIVPYLSTYVSGIMQMGNRYGYNFFDTLTSNRGMQIDLIVSNYIQYLKDPEKGISVLFGAGYSKVNYILNSAKSDFQVIEWDFHGLYYYLGLGTLLLIVIFLCNCVRKGLYFIKRKNRLLSYFTICLFAAIGHGLLGGHVFYESMTLQYFVVICAFISAAFGNKKMDKRIVRQVNVINKGIMPSIDCL